LICSSNKEFTGEQEASLNARGAAEFRMIDNVYGMEKWTI